MQTENANPSAVPAEPHRKRPTPLATAMFNAGIQSQHVAASAGVNRTTVCNVIAGRDKSARVVVAIAQLIKKSERWVLEQIENNRRFRRQRPSLADIRPPAVKECDAALENDQE